MSFMEWSNLITDVYKCSCNYLIVSMFLAFISVFVLGAYEKGWTTWLLERSPCKTNPPDDEHIKNTEITSEEHDRKHSEQLSLMSRIKHARHHAIVNTVSSTLTREQLEEEKQMEREQLKAIFNLLQKQGEKFQVSSMEEVQQQLGLYR